MIKLKTIPYITTDDVKELTGEHWGEFEFAQMAENDSYQTLDCADGYLEELYEDLAYEEKEENQRTIEDFEDEEEYERHKRHCRVVRLKNQIKLVEILRKDYGVRDSILIWVSW